MSASVVAAGAGCIGEVQSGYVMPLAQGGSAATPGGVEFHAFGSTGAIKDLWPNAIGASVRQIGDEHVETELQVGWAGSQRVAGDTFVFGRLVFDMLSWQRTDDGDHKLSALSPTLELGVAPLGRGLCISGEASWDVRINEPDRLIAGAFIGLCNARGDKRDL